MMQLYSNRNDGLFAIAHIENGGLAMTHVAAVG
jgi:hypothetical protein